MTNLKFDRESTALLLIDPYNDFISVGGKLWDRIYEAPWLIHFVAGSP